MARLGRSLAASMCYFLIKRTTPWLKVGRADMPGPGILPCYTHDAWNASFVMFAARKAQSQVLATGCSSLIHLPQQALVTLLVQRVLGVKHGGRAKFLQSTPPVTFRLQCEAEEVVR